LSWMTGVLSNERVLLQSMLENSGRDLAELGVKSLHSLHIVIVVPIVIVDTLLEDRLRLYVLRNRILSGWIHLNLRMH
jgi:hypothetical protein